MDGDQMMLRRSKNMHPGYGLWGWLVLSIVHWMSELVPALESEEQTFCDAVGSSASLVNGARHEWSCIVVDLAWEDCFEYVVIVQQQRVTTVATEENKFFI